MGSDVCIEQGSEHHGNHESRKNVAQWKGGWIKRRFLKCWDPYEDKKIHGTFKDRLRQAENDKDGVYIEIKPIYRNE